MGIVKALASEKGDPHIVSVRMATISTFAPELTAKPSDNGMFGDNSDGGAVYAPILRESASIIRSSEHGMRMSTSNGSTVVSGGLGGLGALVARWLTLTDSCQNMILVGRHAQYQSAPPAFGSGNVTVVKGDMGLAENTHVLSRYGPLHSFHHAAGMLLVSLYFYFA